MANYQVLYSGELVEHAQLETVQENLARELGVETGKVRQLFSGRTVVLRSQLSQEEALDVQAKLAALGAICRIKDFSPRRGPARYKNDDAGPDRTLRDITAAHLECPRCGHLQLDSSHCARCGINLVQAQKQQRKEDQIIQRKIQALRQQHNPVQPLPALTAESEENNIEESDYSHEEKRDPGRKLGKMLSWLKRAD